MKISTYVTSVIALSVVLGGLLGGCASHDGGQDLQQALDSYQQDLWNATEQYIQTCMADQGFNYQKRPFEEPKMTSAGGLSPFPLAEDEARTRGFGITDEIVAQVTGPENNPTKQTTSSPPEQQSEMYEAALYGSGMDTSGCQSLAWEQANAEIDPTDYTTIVDRIQLVQRIMADPRYTAFWASWSQCMAQQGITAADADALEGDFVDRAARLVTMKDPVFDSVTGLMISPPTQVVDMAGAEILKRQEIAAAVASIQCLEPLKGQWESIVNDAQK